MNLEIIDITNISSPNNLTLFGVSIDAIVSALIAIFVFIIGYYLTRKNELKKNYHHLKTVENYLYTLFTDVEKSVNRRIKAFEDLVEQLKEKLHKDLEMEYVSDYGIDNLKNINWIDYFSVFTSLKKGENDIKIDIFQNINRSIAKITAINNIWLDSYKELLSRQTEYERRWNSAIEGIGKLVDEFVHLLYFEKYNKGTNEFIDKLDEIIGKHQKLPNCRDIYVAIDSLIYPLRNHIKKHPSENIGRRFLEPVMACIYAFKNYDKNRDIFSNQFDNYISILKGSIEVLNENVNRHKKFIDCKPRMLQFWKF